jgi:hypothetical protein
VRESSQFSIDIWTLDKITEIQTGYALDLYVNRLDINLAKLYNKWCLLTIKHDPPYQKQVNSELHCFTYVITAYPVAVNNRPTFWKHLNYLTVWSWKIKFFTKFYFIWYIFIALRSSLLSTYPAECLVNLTSLLVLNLKVSKNFHKEQNISF